MSRAVTLTFPKDRTFRTLPYVNLRRWIFAAFLATACVTSAADALADTPSPEVRARAKANADKGVAAMEAGRWQEAIDLLKLADRMIHAPTHLLFIARAEAKLGRLVKAHETYQDVIKEKLSPRSPRVFVEAQTSAMKEDKVLVEQIPHVRISVDGPDAALADVVMDGRPLDRASLASAIAVDPGEHVFVARVDANESAPVTVTVPEGAERPVRLSMRAKEVPAAAEEAERRPSKRSEGAPNAGLRTGGFVALGVGVVGAAIGTYFLVTQRSEQANANQLMAACVARYSGSCPTTESIAITASDSSANGAAGGAVVGYVVGGVGIAAGVTLLLLSSGSGGDGASRRGTKAASLAVTPVIGPTSFGLRGSF
ncbi:MAG: tetratricopeptide repeat protein [Polyangiaceae bacterium]